MTLQITPFPEDDRTRAERVFAGALVVYRKVPALAPLLLLARERLAETFGGVDPCTAHRHLSAEAYLERANALRTSWRHDDAVRALWIDVLRDVGADPERTYYDWFALRIVPPHRVYPDLSRLHLPPHRDSWGSNVYQQINWWAPVFPLATERTMVVFSEYWRRPIANTSSGWNLAELRRLPPADRKAYPRLAAVTEPMGDAHPVPVVIEPGDLLAFSAQHLHASRPNTSGVARINTECRTVNIDDVRDGRGAPNTDGAAPFVAWDWFKCFTDGRNLAGALDLPDEMARLDSAAN